MTYKDKEKQKEYYKIYYRNHKMQYAYYKRYAYWKQKLEQKIIKENLNLNIENLTLGEIQELCK